MSEKQLEAERAALVRSVTGLAPFLSLIVLAMATVSMVLVLLKDVIWLSYEEWIWVAGYVLFGLGQFLVAFCTAPYSGWGMIKEASRDTGVGLFPRRRRRPATPR